MSHNKPNSSGTGYWRSVEALRGEASSESFADREFQEEATELVVDSGVSRRHFVGILGATATMAGMTSGCVRKPVENILPFAKRPEDLVPGTPMHYASAFQIGGTVTGLVVEQHDGRPTKIEGNPKHLGSQGSTDVWAQADLLNMYDPARSTAPHQGEAAKTWAEVEAGLSELLSKYGANGGQGLAFVLPHVMSPTLADRAQALRSKFPQALLVDGDVTAPHQANAAAAFVTGRPDARVRYQLDGARAVYAADSDFLATGTDHVRLAKEWARTRRVTQPGDGMSRLYSVEPHLTGTGTMADHRLRATSHQVGEHFLALAHAILGSGKVQLPEGANGLASSLPKPELDERGTKFAATAAADLLENQGACAIIVGERQPLWMHGVALLLNLALGNDAKTLHWSATPHHVDTLDLDHLTAAVTGGKVDTVIALGTNPAYDGGAELREALKGKTVVHAGYYRDETGQIAQWHLPLSHALEAWGDLRSSDGTTSIVQPLIAPLHDTRSVLEIANLLASGSHLSGHKLVQNFWRRAGGPRFSDKAWRRWLHDGLVGAAPSAPGGLVPGKWDAIRAALKARVAPAGAYEINFHVDPKVWDGRFVNNGWLQELPHPMTKVAWDNAAYVSAKTAADLGAENGDLLRVTVDGRTLEIALWIAPGQADKTVSIAIGYGREGQSEVSNGSGFDANALRKRVGQWFAGGDVAKGSGTYEVVSTQDHGTMKPPVLKGFEYPERPIALEATQAEFQKDPTFVAKANLMKPERLRHLWDSPELVGAQQWGMTIDLNTCTACNSCVIACQAENNIPVVGKKEVANGREMHWIRIDRYFRGDMDEPTAVVQPMLCQHCENAPCETVCPVAATTHSPEGLNDMAYNRCIGTRYCANNCPYKVRRFNFFNFNLDIDPVEQMSKNPDVTIRFRGVMEKCTYCVQRINKAKIAAHVRGENVIDDFDPIKHDAFDGTKIVVACEQACPTEAITFGDVKNPNSRVSKEKAQQRDYAVLSDLNTKPRTTYLARIRNPNPELA